MARGRGFTVIEILIVLTIISVLVSMAIPRFLVYRMRAQRAEAQTNLSAIMKMETAHFSEHGTYTDNLKRLSWGPTGSPRYIYGFASDAVPAPSGVNDTAELRASGSGGYDVKRMIDAFGNPLAEGDLPEEAVAGQESVVIGAAGNLDRDATLDLITLDSNGNLTVAVDDTEM
jgi:prepilin-type N-terminal cleavage/methylation domain-containing protein